MQRPAETEGPHSVVAALHQSRHRRLEALREDRDRRGSDIPPERLRALVTDLVADLAPDAHQIDELMQRSLRNVRRGLEAEQDAERARIAEGEAAAHGQHSNGLVISPFVTT